MGKKTLDELHLKTCPIKELREFLAKDFHTISHHTSFAIMLDRLESKDKELERLKKEKEWLVEKCGLFRHFICGEREDQDFYKSEIVKELQQALKEEGG